ncbi:MAG: hypothetical protein ABSA52_25575 [Candidatus Binatia bacterium]
MIPTPAPSAGRRVVIRVVDPAGDPIQGAAIWFSINGTRAGIVQTGHSGSASIHVPDSSVVVDVTARLSQFTPQTAQLPPGLDTYTFRFPHNPHLKFFAPPLARCPDGSTGMPCVDCDIGGIIVRICSM